MVLTSSAMMANACQQLKQADMTGDARVRGSCTRLMIIAAILLILEIVVIVFGLKIALRCGRAQGGEGMRVFHIILFLLFPIPYILIALMFSHCAYKPIRR